MLTNLYIFINLYISVTDILSFSCIDLTHDSSPMIVCLYFLRFVYKMSTKSYLSYKLSSSIIFQSIRKINRNKIFR
jgi:hypothetical protein